MAPVVETAVPGVQAMHTALATALEYDPVAQGAQILLETYVPGPQATMTDWRATVLGRELWEIARRTDIELSARSNFLNPSISITTANRPFENILMAFANLLVAYVYRVVYVDAAMSNLYIIVVCITTNKKVLVGSMSIPITTKGNVVPIRATVPVVETLTKNDADPLRESIISI